MMALWLPDKGQPFEVREIPRPEPGPGQVLVEVRAAGINHRDLWIKKGQYAGLSYPTILGSDLCGIVVEGSSNWVGKRVIVYPGLHWGDPEGALPGPSFRVLGMPEQGGFAQCITVDETQLVAAPDTLTDHECAALPVASLTAYRGLVTRGGLQTGHRVLITGIGGGVALAGLQIARALGAEVYVTSGHDSKIKQALALGAVGGANYRQESYPQQLRDLAGKGGFDVIFDGAAGPGMSDLLSVIALGGAIVNYGGTAGMMTGLSPQRLFWKHARLIGTTMGSPADFARMIELYGRTPIHPPIHAVYSLAQAEEAFDTMARGEQMGKLIFDLMLS